MTPARFLLIVAAGWLAACSQSGSERGLDPEVQSRGTIEVTARLVEVPEGAVFQRDLYDYATILKYEVVKSHRGSLAPGSVIYVGHYDPWKPRSQAADKRVAAIGGSVRRFTAGAQHRLALEENMDDHFMGGIVDKYFGKRAGPAYWAIWTNDAD